MEDFLRWWRVRGNRFIFFIAALLIHFIAALIIAGLVIFPAPPVEQNDFKRAYVAPSTEPPPPPPPNTSPPTPSVSLKAPRSSPLISSVAPAPAFVVKMPDLVSALTTAQPSVQPAHVAPPSTAGISAARLIQIKTTVANWRDPGNIREAGGDVHNLQTKPFPVYLAQYADGDWDCNNTFYLGPGTVTSGALPNFLAKVKEWSHGSLIPKPPKSIAISSPDLISDPPPFIFITGHRDFHLTPAEVENLQKYLQAGGAIWGDSAFAGDGSRFDVAFRREMKRVLPDIDKNFEPVPVTHEIFTKGWFPMSELPPGMNYRADPMQMIRIDGKIAVIYTPDDYSDMMTMALAPGSDSGNAQYIPFHQWREDDPIFTNLFFQRDSKFYFRNYEAPSVMDVDKMCMNIVTHLLIRFDDQLQFAP